MPIAVPDGVCSIRFGAETFLGCAETFTSVLEQGLSSCSTHSPTGGQISLGWANAMMCVADLQGSL